MNWLFGLIGAVIGSGLGEDGNVLGAVTGFLCAFLLVSVHRLRGEVAALRLERSRATVAAAPRPEIEPVGLRGAPSTAETATAAPPELGTPIESVEPVAPAPPSVPVPPVAPAIPAVPAEPGWEERLLGRIKAWFTEGNVPVKIGILVTLFGVAAALRLAVAKGYFNLPIELRLASIAAGALVALGMGWRERNRRPAFGLSLQGGALGVLLLTVFAAFRLYGLLPPMLAFALVVVLVAGSAFLAVLQQNMALAVLGFLGGYLAPVLISTGSGNHVALFSYYAVLNAAVFALSWRQNWRLLNLMGFAFTFAVGAAWGRQYYRPELFATVEPFLLLFFFFYIAIGLTYVLRQTEHRRPWVDGTLVFGTPLVAFPLQAAMLKDDRIALAFSALFVALVYAVLVWWLRNRRGERLLTEAYGALALGFATLAVPLAFSAGTTASVWALEGAGVAWIGIRQNRTFPWVSGLLLQLLAAGAYLVGLDRAATPDPAQGVLFLDARFLGAALLALPAFALSLVHDRHRPVRGLAALLFAWGMGWWLVAGAMEMDKASFGIGEWRFAMLYLSLTIALAAILRRALGWQRLDWLVALASVLVVPLSFGAQKEHDAVFAPSTIPNWLLYLVAMWTALSRTDGVRSRSLALAHLALLWTLALAVTLQVLDAAATAQLAQGWRFLALVAPLALFSLALAQRPAWFAWPRMEDFPRYRSGWFVPALALLALAFLVGLFLEGRSEPLAYVPLLNPLEIALFGIAALGHAQARPGSVFRRLWPLLAFSAVTMATLRGVHHLHGEPWGESILQSGFTQASLTVAWSLMGVGAWILGSRRLDRRIWMGGALLMAVVLLKLLFVDREYMGNMPGIVSFMAVGLLLVGVGYIAPSPPRTPLAGEAT